MTTTANNNNISCSNDQFLNSFEKDFLKRLRERKAQLNANINKLKEEINSIKQDISCFDLNDKQILEKFNFGKQKFNESPEKGIQYLISEKLIQEDPKSIARFLFNSTNGLSKRAIGIYLGKNNELNKQTLKEYINQQSFKDISLIDALRIFLKRFLIPSESQIIDRIMQNFAAKYSNQNPIFKSEDDCYILCFAIIMLNTLLHNKKVKSKYKPTVQRFTEDHPNVKKELLVEFYENIKNKPFEMPEDDLNENLNDKPVKDGWLMKKSRFGAHYDRRWFVLSNKCLFYFLSQSDSEPKGIIPLENVKVRESFGKGVYGFEIYSTLGQNKSIKACKRVSDGRIIVTKHLVYKFVTKDIKEEKEWFNALKSNISQNPYFDLLESRKRKFNKHNSLSSSIGLIRNKLIFVK